MTGRGFIGYWQILSLGVCFGAPFASVTGWAEDSARAGAVRVLEARVEALEQLACYDKPFRAFCITRGEPLGEQRILSQRAVSEARSNLNSFQKSFGAISFLQNGNPSGVRLYDIESSSMVKTLGLENGDVVTAVGGVSVVEPQGFIAALTRTDLAVGKELSISLVRGFRVRSLRLTIVK